MKGKPYKKIVNIVTVSMFVLSVALIVIGVRRGELMEVFYKARMICLECIGIG